MIVAVFPSGVTNISVNGLHQWDYGRKMKIIGEDLPTIIEVHFAYIGMNEAIVRSCSMVNGEGIVTIPDKCLEQAAPVYAWIYEINGTTGSTTKTILLNITPRARPQSGETIPLEISDKYTEAITTMNETIEAMQEGDIKVKNAEHSDTADTAGHSSTSGHSDTAGHSETATHSDTARQATTALNVTGVFEAPRTYTNNRLSSKGFYYIYLDRGNTTKYPVLVYFGGATTAVYELDNSALNQDCSWIHIDASGLVTYRTGKTLSDASVFEGLNFKISLLWKVS